ncbi:MAG: T9SS type A sorting domain-containing protein, partial [Chitinophagales bacterium]
NWNTSQIYVLAFIQNDSNQSILNVGSSWKNEIVDIETPLSEANVELYPNPSNDFIHIHTEAILQSAQIFDTQGQLKKKTDFTSFNSNKIVDIRDLPKGIYYLSLQSENRNIVEKIVKW